MLSAEPTQAAFGGRPFRPPVPPLTARRNPQQDFFAAPPVQQPWSGCGFLGAELWQQQKRRLAAYSRDPALRERAARHPAPIDRRSPHSYDWPWPSATSLAISEAYARQPLEEFALTGLQTEEQRDALADLLLEIGQHIGFALSQPCRVHEDGGQLSIELLDCMAWVKRPEAAQLALELRDDEGRWRLAAAGFRLDSPLQGALWLEQALLQWVPQIEASFGLGAFEAHYWLEQKLLHHGPFRHALAVAERQILLHLDLCPLLQGTLQRIAPRVWKLRADSEGYSALWATQPLWKRLHQGAPGLAHFCGQLLAEGRLQRGDDLGAVRRAAREFGLGAAGWRFLCRHGEAAYDSLLRFLSRHSGWQLSGICAYIEWQVRGGLREPLLPEYGAMVARFGHITERAGRIEVPIDPRLARALADACRPAGDAARKARVPLDEWRDLLGWMHHQQPCLDRNQWRAGWPAVRRAYAHWADCRERLQWTSAVGPLSFGHWTVRPLTCGRQLVEEGERMSHCVADYIPDCFEGEYLVFTVEHRGTGQPEATLGLRDGPDGWALDQVRGPRNAAVDGDLLRVARTLLQRYREAAGDG